MKPTRGMSVTCPHCGGGSLTRGSKQLTPIYREQTCVCKNPICGHAFVVGVTALRTLSPSAMPNPDVRLPYSTHVRRRELTASLREATHATT
jgi:hypothetical protein